MKNVRIYLMILLLVLGFSSCEDYLSVDLKQALTLEETFSKRETTENYLANVYSYLPHDWLPHDNEGSVVARSDEGSFSWLSLDYVDLNNGTWGTAHWQYKTWVFNYQGIKQSSIFINNVHLCKELDENTRNVMQAEARFLRAYLYFMMLRKYGPVYVWGDEESDDTTKGEDIDRHSFDVNYNFILDEFNKAIEVLPDEITDEAWYGRVTKGAVMAIKSRLMLYAARPLFNGCDLYKGLTNKDGEYLFPQSPDPQKWEAAAKAAKDVIDLGRYSLYQDTKETDPFLKGIRSYMGILFEQWNDEIIWGRHRSSAWDYAVRAAPPRAVLEGYGGYCPSIKLVDTYPMAKSGRFPVTGYQNNGAPIIDPLSGYTDEGFTEPWTHPIESYASIKAHNSVVGRDARFYASVLSSGMYWINRYKGDKLITFFNGGTSTYTGAGDCVKVGYLWRRMSDPTNNHEDNKWGTYVQPLARLAEIYLNYAEACNEKPNRDEAEALKYVNLIRARVNLNKLEEAYPEVKGNQNLLRELIAKERMVELAFENQRYYDIRTCMTAPKEFNGRRFGRNVMAYNYEDSWARTDAVFNQDMVFKDRHYFFPIHQEQQAEMVNFTQNYGW
ncbi:MAG: RagB/SusD family nutrient uptake outer membrane protein [Prevotella sp.]|jgi:hypothetical protein|nr:RagB/SusD family nutrient uptake outer membrane protein [Prevotella sp.]